MKHADLNRKTMATKEMAQILSGNFAIGKDAKGKDKQGNFSGYNENGQRIFISKQLMSSLGFNADSDLKKDGKFVSFFAIYDEKEIPTADANGELTLTAKRVQATSLFATEDAMINAYYASERRKIVGQGGLKTLASTVGLNEASVNAILTASI
jgi:hypothetical protein